MGSFREEFNRLVEDRIEFWENTGLLEGIIEEERKIVSEVLSSMACSFLEVEHRPEEEGEQGDLLVGAILGLRRFLGECQIHEVYENWKSTSATLSIEVRFLGDEPFSIDFRPFDCVEGILRRACARKGVFFNEFFEIPKELRHMCSSKERNELVSGLVKVSNAAGRELKLAESFGKLSEENRQIVIERREKGAV
jgi:hypothetical protein